MQRKTDDCRGIQGPTPSETPSVSRAVAAIRSIKKPIKTASRVESNKPSALEMPKTAAALRAAKELRSVAELARSNGWAGKSAGSSLQAFLAEQLAKAALVDQAGPAAREHIQRSINAVQALREMSRVTAPLEGPSFLDQIRPQIGSAKKRALPSR